MIANSPSRSSVWKAPVRTKGFSFITFPDTCKLAVGSLSPEAVAEELEAPDEKVVWDQLSYNIVERICFFLFQSFP